MPDVVEAKLVADIEACLARTGVKESRFGRDAVNDSNILKTLKLGREVRRDMRERIYAEIERLDAELTAASREDAA